jgi:hypothetical protein
MKLFKSASLQKLVTSSQRYLAIIMRLPGLNVSSASSLETLRVDLVSLKTASQKAFTSVSDARVLVGDVKEMKTTIADALKGQ